MRRMQRADRASTILVIKPVVSQFSGYIEPAKVYDEYDISSIPETKWVRLVSRFKSIKRGIKSFFGVGNGGEPRISVGLVERLRKFKPSFIGLAKNGNLPFEKSECCSNEDVMISSTLDREVSNNESSVNEVISPPLDSNVKLQPIYYKMPTDLLNEIQSRVRMHLEAISCIVTIEMLDLQKPEESVEIIAVSHDLAAYEIEPIEVKEAEPTCQFEDLGLVETHDSESPPATDRLKPFNTSTRLFDIRKSIDESPVATEILRNRVIALHVALKEISNITNSNHREAAAYQASATFNMEIVEMLLNETGCKVFAYDVDGRFPVLCEATWKHIDVIKRISQCQGRLLIEYSSDPEISVEISESCTVDLDDDWVYVLDIPGGSQFVDQDGDYAYVPLEYENGEMEVMLTNLLQNYSPKDRHRDFIDNHDDKSPSASAGEEAFTSKVACTNRNKKKGSVTFGVVEMILQICQDPESTPYPIETLKKCIDGLHLLNLDINTTRTPKDNWTPLQMACAYGNLAIVEVLINYAKCKVNVHGVDGWFPLHCAVAQGHIDIIKLLARCQGRLKNETLIHADEKSEESRNLVLPTGCPEDCIYVFDGPIDLQPPNINGDFPVDLAFEAHEDKQDQIADIFNELILLYSRSEESLMDIKKVGEEDEVDYISNCSTDDQKSLVIYRMEALISA